ncbi:MAG: hypothetical protein UX65_C0006G0036 [Parcubacteria group bacterium GW2011_GWB1_46_8]|nr:MAG: hypothetical protein UX14_C0007G0004 [Parcubacteria group bacterium GW2011_GWF1_45_5]KKU46271.1 MAG: hypothetical protein UX65_C0006G0036 [Parcubacteria group bacterium GW2011_GWB1_46_8]KKU47454.1 MAG: hypothetical protein UX66_C0013G0003 [Parcubacteria group bacterium GW2011_GWF2_46_8]
MTKTELAEELRQLILKKDEKKMASFLAEHFDDLPEDMQMRIAAALVTDGTKNISIEQYRKQKQVESVLTDMRDVIGDHLKNVEA